LSSNDTIWGSYRYGLGIYSILFWVKVIMFSYVWV